MKLIFIRHLSTPGNEKRQYIGRTDEELSETAEKTFSCRKYPPVQYVICSPLKRCVRTAQLLYPGQKAETEEMLRECDFGEYEQKTYEELKKEPEYIRWMESGGMTAFPGGEDPAVFRARCAEGIKKWIDILLDRGADCAAFVVHGGTIMSAFSELAEEPGEFYRWQAENGGGYEAEVSEQWKTGEKILKDIKKIPESSCEKNWDGSEDIFIAREKMLDYFTGKNLRFILPQDDHVIAGIIRDSLEKYHLDIPGTAYYDPELEHLSRYYDMSQHERAYFIAYNDEGGIAGGVGIARFEGFDRCAEIQKLYVKEDDRGRGYGGKLMEAAQYCAYMAGYSRLYLETHTNLEAAIKMYDKLGFRQIEKPESVLHGTMDRFYLKEI